MCAEFLPLQFASWTCKYCGQQMMQCFF